MQDVGNRVRIPRLTNPMKLFWVTELVMAAQAVVHQQAGRTMEEKTTMIPPIQVREFILTRFWR